MKKLDKMRMIRPSDAFLPAALLIASALGKSDMAEYVFLEMWLIQLFALASARGLRLAFSEQPSMRRVRGSVKTALLLQIPGALLIAALYLVHNAGRYSPSLMICIGAGLLLNIEHVFYEYLFATGDSHSAIMTRAVTSALTLGGLMMLSDNSHGGLLPYGLEWLLGAAGISAAVSAIIGLTVGGPLKGRCNAQVLKCAPLSMLQTLVYPVAHFLLSMAWPGTSLRLARTALPLFAGMIVYELCRAPFRRTAMESRAMNRTLLIIGAVALAGFGMCLVPAVQGALKGILKGCFNDLPAAAIMIAVGCICGFGMFGSVRMGSED